jgi:hypothetical protein
MLPIVSFQNRIQHRLRGHSVRQPDGETGQEQCEERVQLEDHNQEKQKKNR